MSQNSLTYSFFFTAFCMWYNHGHCHSFGNFIQMKERKGFGFDVLLSPWKLSKTEITINVMQHVCDVLK